jgi:hypothetical protein
MRVLGAFCVFAAMFWGATQAAFAEACTFNKAVYESLADDDLLLWSDHDLPWPESLFTDGGKRDKRSYRFGRIQGTNTFYVRRSHDEFSEWTVPYYFAASASCALEAAVYENMEDRSISARMNPDRDAPLFGLKLVVQGDKTPKRSYLFDMQNGTGKIYISDEVEGGDGGGAGFHAFDGHLNSSGIKLVLNGADIAPKFIFMPGLPKVPDAMFRLKECKPVTPAKPAAAP